MIFQNSLIVRRKYVYVYDINRHMIAWIIYHLLMSFGAYKMHIFIKKYVSRLLQFLSSFKREKQTSNSPRASQFSEQKRGK